MRFEELLVQDSHQNHNGVSLGMVPYLLISNGSKKTEICPIMTKLLIGTKFINTSKQNKCMYPSAFADQMSQILISINRRLYSHEDNPDSKVSKGAKIRNRYNQVPHLTQDTNGKVTN